MAKLTFLKPDNFTPPHAKQKSGWSVMPTDRQTCANIQKYLFGQGYKWPCHGQPMNLHAKYLDLDIFSAKEITWNDSRPFGKLITFSELKTKLGN